MEDTTQDTLHTNAGPRSAGFSQNNVKRVSTPTRTCTCTCARTCPLRPRLDFEARGAAGLRDWDAPYLNMLKAIVLHPRCSPFVHCFSVAGTPTRKMSQFSLVRVRRVLDWDSSDTPESTELN